MIYVKIKKTQRIDDRSVTDELDIKGDAGEVLSFLDEMGYTVPLDDSEQQSETVH